MPRYYAPEPQGRQPQSQQPQDPYNSYNPYSAYDSNPYQMPQEQSTYPAQSYPPQSYAAQQPQQAQMSSPASSAVATSQKKTGAQIWSMLVRFLGVSGVFVTAGALLAILAFYAFPYFSNYSGYFFAHDTLDDKWWLELILPLLALAVLIATRLIPRVKQQMRTWSLVVTGSGLLGIILQYWFINGMISSNYWRIGTWSYFLGMALVAMGGLALFLQRARD